jgi:hypothetical protein
MTRHIRHSQATTRGPMYGSALHLLDIENLCLGRVFPATCVAVWDHYQHQVGVSSRDQIVVAANTVGAASAFFALPSTARRLLVPVTPDAADRALIESVDLERVALRHNTVFIASADGAFAPLAHNLRARGLRVVQVVAAGSRIAAHLYTNCDELRQLPLQVTLPGKAA